MTTLKSKTIKKVKYGDFEDGGLIQKMVESNNQFQKDYGNNFVNAINAEDAKTYLKNYQKALGPARGGYKPIKENGLEVGPNVWYYDSLLKRMAYTDETGKVMYQNKEVIDKASAAIIEHKKRLDELVKVCILDDELCCMKLQEEMKDLVGALGNIDCSKRGFGTTPVMDCTPSGIKLQPAGSKEYMFAVHELRKHVEQRMNYANEISFNINPEVDVKDPIVTKRTGNDVKVDNAINSA